MGYLLFIPSLLYPCGLPIQWELESKGSLPLDCTALLADSALSAAIPDLADVIRNQPETTLNQMALALHTVSYLQLMFYLKYTVYIGSSTRRIHVLCALKLLYVHTFLGLSCTSDKCIPLVSPTCWAIELINNP